MHHCKSRNRLMEASFFAQRGFDFEGRGGRGRGGHGGHGFFGRFGGGGFGGPNMRASKMLSSDDLQLVILELLNQKERHGYEIIKALGEHSSGLYSPSPGMVYPALTYLEEVGYAASETVGTKKLFRITPLGVEHLTQNQAAAKDTMEALARFGQRMARWQKQGAEEDAANEDFAGDLKGQAKADWRQMKMEFRELKDQLKSALMEKLDASAEEKKRVLAVLRKAVEEIRGK